jgi:hypothetical protein
MTTVSRIRPRLHAKSTDCIDTGPYSSHKQIYNQAIAIEASPMRTAASRLTKCLAYLLGLQELMLSACCNTQCLRWLCLTDFTEMLSVVTF